MNVFHQPVCEVGQRLSPKLLRKPLLYIRVAAKQVYDRLRLTVFFKGLAGIERIHAFRAFRDVEVEGSLAVTFRKNKVRNLPLLLCILYLVAQKDEKQGERGQPLLAVDDEFLAVLVTDDDRSEKIMAVISNG
jgi:hypothetical protein